MLPGQIWDAGRWGWTDREAWSRCECPAERRVAGVAEACGFTKDTPESGRAGDPTDWAQAVNVLAAACLNVNGYERVPAGDQIQPVADAKVLGAVEYAGWHDRQLAEGSRHGSCLLRAGDGDFRWEGETFGVGIGPAECQAINMCGVSAHNRAPSGGGVSGRGLPTPCQHGTG